MNHRVRVILQNTIKITNSTKRWLLQSDCIVHSTASISTACPQELHISTSPSGYSWRRTYEDTFCGRPAFQSLQVFSGGRRMHDILGRDNCRSVMSNAIYSFIENCNERRKEGTWYKPLKTLKLLSETGSFKFISIHILGPLPKRMYGNWFVTVMMDRYCKHTGAETCSRTSATHRLKLFINNRINPDGIIASLLSDRAPRLVSELFSAIGGVPGIKQFIKITYHLQKNGQAGRDDSALRGRPEHVQPTPRKLGLVY